MSLTRYFLFDQMAKKPLIFFDKNITANHKIYVNKF